MSKSRGIVSCEVCIDILGKKKGVDTEDKELLGVCNEVNQLSVLAYHFSVWQRGQQSFEVAPFARLKRPLACAFKNCSPSTRCSTAPFSCQALFDGKSVHTFISAACLRQMKLVFPNPPEHLLVSRSRPMQDSVVHPLGSAWMAGIPLVLAMWRIFVRQRLFVALWPRSSDTK